MQSLGWLDAVGFMAGALTLATFAQTSIKSMRFTAIVANLCFLTYGIAGGFVPIFILHGLLLSINLVRLRGLYPRQKKSTWQIELAQARSDPGFGIVRRHRAGRSPS